MKKTSKTWPDVWYEVDFPFLAGPWSWDRETSAHISRNFLRWICVCVCMLEHLMDVPSSRSSLWFQDARVDEQSTNTSTNSIRDMWGLEDQGDQTARWQESQSQKRLLKNTFQPLTYGSYDRFQKISDFDERSPNSFVGRSRCLDLEPCFWCQAMKICKMGLPGPPNEQRVENGWLEYDRFLLVPGLF